ncbi:MAG: DUF4340 domain-containing protein, partial [Gemmataceae bacterium]|nr:DUF4340 domain-containing protein [Gemmataceae bacterium]
YARVGGKEAVFTVPRLLYDRFVGPDLRDRVVFRAVPADQVTRVELKGWGGLTGTPAELTFEKNKDGVWVTTKSSLGAFTADPGKVAAFVEMLARERVRSFERGVPDVKHGFGDPKQALSATLHWPGAAAAVNLGAPTDATETAYYGWSSLLPQSDPVFVFDAALFKPFKDKPAGFARQ